MGRHINHRALAALTVLTITLAACGGDDEESAAVADARAVDEQLDVAGDDALAVGQGETVAPATVAPEAPAAAPGGSVDPTSIDPTSIDLGIVGRDVIVEMYVIMSSPDLPRSVAQITARASALGGGIASSTVDYGDPAVVNPPEAYAILVVKVPPDQVDRLLGDLGDAGTVRSLEQSAQDVTDQLVDLEVRIANARQSVENVRGFMERAQNLTELVGLEAELTRRQTELEQLEAQQRSIRDRVALSTITVEVRPEASLPPTEQRSGIRGAFADGWDAFVTVVRGGVIVLAVLAPFLVTGALLAALLWFAWRRWAVASDRDRMRAHGPAPVDDDAVSDRDDVPTPMG